MKYISQIHRVDMKHIFLMLRHVAYRVTTVLHGDNKSELKGKKKMVVTIFFNNFGGIVCMGNFSKKKVPLYTPNSAFL
jgi:hypothetical protein